MQSLYMKDWTCFNTCHLLIAEFMGIFFQIFWQYHDIEVLILILILFIWETDMKRQKVQRRPFWLFMAMLIILILRVSVKTQIPWTILCVLLLHLRSVPWEPQMTNASFSLVLLLRWSNLQWTTTLPSHTRKVWSLIKVLRNISVNVIAHRLMFCETNKILKFDTYSKCLTAMVVWFLRFLNTMIKFKKFNTLAPIVCLKQLCLCSFWKTMNPVTY